MTLYRSSLNGKISAPKGKLGLVVALPAEGRAMAGGRWLRQDGWMVKRRFTADGEEIWVQCGIGPQRAAAAARWLVAQQVDCLAVFGVSGGLNPDLTTGDLVLASAVVDRCAGEKAFYLDLDVEGCKQILPSLGFKVRCGSILTVSEPVLHPVKKAALFSEHDALAVDMESAAVARVAAETAIPCTVVRSICDPAQRAIPADAMDIIDQRGHLRWWRLFSALFKRPGMLLDLRRMQGDFSRALQSLRQGAPVVVRQMMNHEQNP